MCILCYSYVYHNSKMVKKRKSHCPCKGKRRRAKCMKGGGVYRARTVRRRRRKQTGGAFGFTNCTWPANMFTSKSTKARCKRMRKHEADIELIKAKAKSDIAKMKHDGY
jgi:hypothetical protein